MPDGIDMSEPLRAFRRPVVPSRVPVAETDTSFADLVRMLGESIADAQASLDRTSAELVAELARTEVDIIPQVTEVIQEDGSIRFEQGAPQTVSLLHLGVRPTFYQFSQATVEVAMDIQLVETLDETGREKRFSLFARTSDLRFERKLNRDVRVSSKLTATLVPVPMPLRLEPVRSSVIEPETPE